MRPMNLINLMNYAWDDKQKTSAKEYALKFRNLISHAYVDILEKNKNISSDYDRPFYAIQEICVFIIKCDDDFLQGEYDAYVNFCNYAKFQPLSVKDVTALRNRKTLQDLSNTIVYIKYFRTLLNDDKYEALILGFCYLSLLGDTAFDENEYYILRTFFDQGYDYCPSDWSSFKREWK